MTVGDRRLVLEHIKQLKRILKQQNMYTFWIQCGHFCTYFKRTCMYISQNVYKPRRPLLINVSVTPIQYSKGWYGNICLGMD